MLGKGGGRGGWPKAEQMQPFDSVFISLGPEDVVKRNEGSDN